MNDQAKRGRRVEELSCNFTSSSIQEICEQLVVDTEKSRREKLMGREFHLNQSNGSQKQSRGSRTDISVTKLNDTSSQFQSS